MGSQTIKHMPPRRVHDPSLQLNQSARKRFYYRTAVSQRGHGIASLQGCVKLAAQRIISQTPLIHPMEDLDKHLSY